MSKKNEINWEEWQAALHELSSKQLDIIPVGWITPEYFGAGVGLGPSHARRQLVELFRAGKAERKKFYVQSDAAGIRPIWHYRLKK